jgi:molybdopterin converting factor small subunit
MKVKAKFFGDLKAFSPGNQDMAETDLPEGATVGEMVDAFGMNRGELWRASVSKQLVELDHPLKDGDEVLLFPPIGGG